MKRDVVPGSVFPDYELPDHEGIPRRLSDLQGDNAMVLLLGRGEHCRREHLHQQEMVKFHEWCEVAFTSLVTVLPNEVQDVHDMRASTGADWPFLADADLTLRRSLEIEEYTDTQHNATVPHTIVLAPGLVVDKVFIGYWFWGRPSPYQLWADLQDLFRRIKPDFDPTLPGPRAEWDAAH